MFPSKLQNTPVIAKPCSVLPVEMKGVSETVCRKKDCIQMACVDDLCVPTGVLV